MQGRTTRMTERRRLAAITGMSGMASDLAGKCVELSRDLLPQVKRGAALLNASDPFSKAMLDKIQAAGKTIGIEIEPVLIQKPDEFDVAFASLEKAAPDTVIVQPSLPTATRRRTHDQAPASGAVAGSYFRRVRWTDGICSRPPRPLSPRRRHRRQGAEGHQAR